MWLCMQIDWLNLQILQHLSISHVFSILISFHNFNLTNKWRSPEPKLRQVGFKWKFDIENSMQTKDTIDTKNEKKNRSTLWLIMIFCIMEKKVVKKKHLFPNLLLSDREDMKIIVVVWGLDKHTSLMIALR